MDWLAIAFWTYMIVYVVSVALGIYQVGKPRKPVTPEVGAAAFVIQVLVFLMLIQVWNRGC